MIFLVRFISKYKLDLRIKKAVENQILLFRVCIYLSILFQSFLDFAINGRKIVFT
jgi:hypothetical protein